MKNANKQIIIRMTGEIARLRAKRATLKDALQSLEARRSEINNKPVHE